MRSPRSPLALLGLFAILPACAHGDDDAAGGDPQNINASADEGYIDDAERVAVPAPPNALPRDYAGLSADAKQKALWSLVSSGEYCAGKSYGAPDCALPRGRSFSFRSLPSLFSLGTTFDTSSDEMPAGRRKLLRPVGIVATFELVADYPEQPADGVSRRGPYTGLLAPGRGPALGVLRFSDNGVTSFNPAVALKFFIDGKPSVNTLAAVSMDGQGDDHNFFAHPITSHLEPARGLGAKVIWTLFKIVKPDPSLIELDNLAEVSKDGTTLAAGEVRAPYELYYVGHGDLGKRFDAAKHEYREDLHGLSAGKVVYDVLARASAKDAPTSLEKIAEIRLTSTPVATSEGDARLFFQHHR